MSSYDMIDYISKSTILDCSKNRLVIIVLLIRVVLRFLLNKRCRDGIINPAGAPKVRINLRC